MSAKDEMSPDSSADRRESEAFFSTHQGLINTIPIARGEEATHIYATLSLLLSPDIRQGRDVPRIVDNIQAASYRGERPNDSSFTLFPELPTEIQLNIWRHALLVPRIVEIGFDKSWLYRSETVPPLLSCNRESRIEYLKAHSTYNDTFSQWIRFDVFGTPPSPTMRKTAGRVISVLYRTLSNLRPETLARAKRSHQIET
jgi:hypothetical protein